MFRHPAKGETIEDYLIRLLTKVKSGEIQIEEALVELRTLPYEDLGFAKVDHHRALRQGLPEVVFGYGKTAEQVVAIGESLLSRSDRLLVTRVGEDCFRSLQA